MGCYFYITISLCVSFYVNPVGSTNEKETNKQNKTKENNKQTNKTKNNLSFTLFTILIGTSTLHCNVHTLQVSIKINESKMHGCSGSGQFATPLLWPYFCDPTWPDFFFNTTAKILINTFVDLGSNYSH